MIVLKIIGYIILGILALIILALCVKVKIFAEYSEVDTNVKLQWLFIKIPIYPSSGNKKVKKTVDKTTTEEEPVQDLVQENLQEATVDETVTENTQSDENIVNSDDAQLQQKPKNNLLKTIYNAHGIDGLLLIVQRLFRYLGTFFGDLMKSLVVDNLYLDVRCTKNDAASTAIYYGEVCSSLFPMLGALVTKYKVKKYDINVYPDFLAKHSSASFAVSIHLYPIYVIGISIALVIKLIFKVLLRLIVKCFLPAKEKGQENGKAGKNQPAEKINIIKRESECSK